KWAAMIPVAISVAALTISACGANESTVSKTPGPLSPSVTTPAPAAAPTPAAPSSGPVAPPPGADPCEANLAAPEIARAVSDMPRDPRSIQGWSPEPLDGNYNECALLSAVIVKANTNAENPNPRAVMFHRGKFIPSGV